MLIIVESPAKAKTIARIVGKDYTVKASVGHIRGLSNTKKTKDGKTLEIGGIDIENNFLPIYEIDRDKKKVVNELKSLAKKSKVILFATDADREGEAISWHLSEVLGIKDKSKVQRLEFHEITKQAIDQAVAHPRSMNMELVEAQQARQVLAKLVGFKLSPVLWKVMSNYKLSAGRVQSPALALVCQREQEIEDFVPEEYWEIFGDFKAKANTTAKVTVVTPETKNKPEIEDLLRLISVKGNKLSKSINNQKTLEEFLQGIEQHTKFEVTNVNHKEEYGRTKPPFITSTLQQSASSSFGFTPRQTMQLAQKLYEGVVIDGHSTGLITYMRTDSTNLSQEAVTKIRSYLKSNFAKYLPDKAKYYKSRSKNAQEAHEAIRPTDPLLTPEKLQTKLEPKLLKLYDLIWRRTMASQMTDEVRQRVAFELQNQRQDKFSGSVAWTISPGYKILTKEKILTPKDLKYEKGQIHYLHDLLKFQKFTQPPSRYSPASLIKKLEELGIGRPSTYASIISTLTIRNYAELIKNILYPTILGRQINKILTEKFAEVTSSQLTAKMEDDLDEISLGKATYQEVLKEFWLPFKKHVEEVQLEVVEKKEDYNSTKTDQKCPDCESEMLIKNGRFGQYYQCLSHREHQFALNYKEYEQALKTASEEFASQTKGKKCDLCSKDLVVKVSKKGLQPYISCPDYRVGNKHTVMAVTYGECPKCQEEGRKGKKAGMLVRKKGFRGTSFIGCSLDKDKCGYIQKKQNPS